MDFFVNLSKNFLKSEKELDNINLLYVALTRAEEQLHIITNKEFDNAKKYLSKLEDKMYQNMAKEVLNEIEKYYKIYFYLVNSLGYKLDEVNSLLQNESGMIGITEGLIDLRDIEAEAEKGNKKCQLALDMNAYRVKQYLGSFIATLNGVDAIVFTAGVGENSIVLRKLICDNLEVFGIEIDEEKNDIKARKLTEIHSTNSKVKILIVPTNEEVEIAKQSFELIS